MKLFGALLKRNSVLYWHSIYVRLFLLLGTTIVVLIVDHLRKLSFAVVFYGIVQQPGSFEIPIVWLFLILSPLLVVGDSINSLVKENYPLVSYVPLQIYLGTIFVVVIITTSFIWLTWFIILAGWQYFLFSLNVLIIICVTTLIYSLLQIFISPIITVFIFLGILVATIAINHFPIFSQLMYGRYGTEVWLQTSISLIILIVIILFLSKRIYKLDFLCTKH